MDSHPVLPEHPIHNVSRRRFMPAAGGLVLGLNIGQAGPRGGAAGGAAQTAARSPNAFVRVGQDGWVTVLAKHLDADQGAHTGLATLVAEELDADWRQVRVEGTPAHAGAGRSGSMAQSYLPIRRAGAAARAMLVEAAARQWRVPASEIVIRDGIVRHPHSQRQAGIGHLAAAAAALPAPQDPALKAPAEFKLIGKEGVGRADNPGKTNGTAVFTQDFKLPGMLVAVAARAPRPGARLAGYDGLAARGVAGVRAVVEIPATPQHPAVVAVLAENTWAARLGRDALQARWEDDPSHGQRHADPLAGYRAAVGQPGPAVMQEGDVDAAFARAASIIEADFLQPLAVQAAMEPLSCLVRLADRRCDIWNGEPVDPADQAAIARYLKVPAGGVTVTALHAGGSNAGPRRGSQAGYLIEAVALARAARRQGLDVPIKLTWTPEDDLHGGHVRPMRLQRARLALDAAGAPLAWHVRHAGLSPQADPAQAAARIDPPYAAPHQRLEQCSPPDGDPPAWHRPDGHAMAFAAETLIDQAALAAGQDPVAYRAGLLAGQPRHARALALAAQQADWGRPLPRTIPNTRRGRGVALHAACGTVMALVAEVTVRPCGALKVDRVVCAVDCGVAINPGVLRAQLEGGIGAGLANCLHGLPLTDSEAQQDRFHASPVLRMDEMPRVEMHIVPSSDAPAAGVATVAADAVAPAVGNALHAATAQRLHALPFSTKMDISAPGVVPFLPPASIAARQQAYGAPPPGRSPGRRGADAEKRPQEHDTGALAA
ncbi:exported oxidoreductase subunit [Bordetella ansorpii]|uniref:Exported oxidoreductase subunit n=1 Tax=Bordetella ansorpii TaxID=288768 RepID=A0A157SMC8_9BORD|nr:molybdopterin cofactor-binding domain-containing protein [Bordetella ansorpii]SAI71545.1 exported oxidoreductase subunit [Bordetella ansorpii]